MAAPASGIGRFTVSLVAELGRSDDFRYLGMAHRAFADLKEELPDLEFETQPAPLGAIWQQLRLPKRLAQGDVDLFWSPLFTLPLRSRLPAVVTVHDLTAVLFPETHRRKVRWSIQPLLEPTLNVARRILADSRSTADDLRFHFPSCAERVEVVYPGVDPEFRPAEQEEVAAIREELDCPSGYLLYAGVLEPRKNLDALLDAWEVLRDDQPGTPPLVLAGPIGWRTSALERRLGLLEPRGLRVLGRLDRPRLVQVMQGASVFVYPSLYEGFGLPVAEAMACGVPVVTSQTSSLPEVVGEAGLLIDPHDSGAIASAIRSLIDEPAHAAELMYAGLEQVRQFTWDRAARQMEHVFRRALE